jgi:biopolymer transport protein ExbB/TolQ
MNSTPYATPVESAVSITSPEELRLIRNKMTFWTWGIWISVAVMVGAPMIGLLFTVMGMRNAFSELGNSGIANPEQLGAHIGEVLIATVVGLFFSVVGIPPLVVSIIQHKKWKNRLSA